ncbi:hypothetical protein I350_02482 [Cryptococcus amylolentus CBS 6273]|nr:hypothetical protein I350_02482 [Cryptococcus amylolentus CBS 6273]
MSGSHHACMFENLRDIEFTSNFCREFLNNSRGWRDEYMSIGKFWGGHPEYSEYFLFANPDLTLVCLQIPESEEFAGVRMPSFVELGPLCTLVDKLISGPILTIHIPDSLVYYPWFSDEDYPSNFIYMLPPRPLGALGEEDDGDMALYEAEIVA